MAEMAGFVTDVVKLIFPVGAIYIKTSNENPHDTLGVGMWEAFATGVTQGNQLNFILPGMAMPPNATTVCHLWKRTA